MYPKLQIDIDEAYDTGRFCAFFMGQKPDLQASIMRKYLGIFDTVLSLDGEESKKAIQERVGQLYREYDDRLRDAQIRLQYEADRVFQDCIRALMETMNFDISKAKESYRWVLSLLPFSPFDRDERTFSISIHMLNDPMRAIQIATHEISHFFFQNWLRESEFSELADFGNWLNYVAKESITPVLLRNWELWKFFPNTRWNPNVEQLRIEWFDGSFVDWCEQIYLRHPGDFDGFAREVMRSVILIQDDLSERKTHWDGAYRWGISEDVKKRELEAFGVPIKLPQEIFWE